MGPYHARFAQTSKAIAAVAIATPSPGRTRGAISPAEPYYDWREVLDYLTRAADVSPALLVLDEFPECTKVPSPCQAFCARSSTA
ncbi:MAG: hypothetical protein ACRDNZ_02705 [Streptosporangiaceae bacterium]